MLRVIDSGGPQSCGPGCSGSTLDSFTVSDTSDEFLSGVTWNGTLRTTSLALNWWDSGNPLSFLTLTDDFDIADVLALAIGPNVSSSLSESWLECVNDVCSNGGSRSTNFLVTSVTRSVTSVPEPGTLALLTIALLGASVTRRRASIRGRVTFGTPTYPFGRINRWVSSRCQSVGIPPL